MKKFFGVALFFVTATIYCHSVLQKTNELNKLLNQAQDTQMHLVEALKKINVGVNIIDPGVKGIETINRLLRTRANGDAASITDYVRATVVVKDFHEIYSCLETLKKDFYVLSVDDHYADPFPEMYRDINIIFEDPFNGHIGEIQINSMAMVSFKNSYGHDLFDKIRKIRAKEIFEKRQLTNEEKDELEVLTGMSKNGYNSAFASSHNGTRIGIYGICISEKKVLMVKTQSGTRTIYNFPGGGAEDCEGFIDTLRRECLEELGCDVLIGNLLWASDRLYKHPDFSNNSFHLYYAMSLSPRLDKSIQDAQWFDIDNLPLSMMLEIDKAIVPYLKHRIKAHDLF